MKRILLSALLGLFSVVAFAQNDISVTLDSPAANGTIGAGIAFNYTVTVTNSGSTALSMSDTIINVPLFNGNPLQTSGGGIVGWFEMDNIAAGATKTFTHSLTIQGGSSGPIDVCAFTFLIAGESDSLNNDACNMVSYDDALSIGDLKEASVSNNSFYANGIFNVVVESAFGHNNATVSIVNINGQTVVSEALDIHAGVIECALNVEHLASGIYIVNIQSASGIIAPQKVMIN